MSTDNQRSDLNMDSVAKEAGRRKNALLKSIDDALNELKSKSVQIMKMENGAPVQEGSGFYLSYKGRIFLVSAAHVFDDPPENERYVFDDSGALKLISGSLIKHKFDGDRDDDIMDVIAVEVADLQPKHVIEGDWLDLGTEFQEDYYAFLGYPGTKNGPIFGTTVMKNRPYSYYDRSLDASKVTSFSYDDRLNILIRYQHKKTITNGGSANKGARMKGISGGPVFRLSSSKDLSSWDKGRIRLAGVVIHTVERHNYMAAVRIKVLTDALDCHRQFECLLVEASSG